MFVLTNFHNESVSSFIFIYFVINDSYILTIWKNADQRPGVINWAEVSPKQTASTIWSMSLRLQWFKEGSLYDYY